MKLVTAKHLQSWSDSLTARADLPGIIASLIRASCPRLDSYRFPSGDASQTHGFDGVAEVGEATLFVPEGRSIWEFGVGKNYKAKADEDYEKRTKQLSAEERSKQSFIFVTSRIWDTGLTEWEQQREKDGWREVRVIDAASLEHWLSDHPAVALPFARQLGIIPPTGVRTIPELWDDYRLAFAPPLKEELLLAGREERAKRLCEALTEGLHGLSRWQADSPMEAAAFVAAAIMSADPEISAFLRDKTLFLETAEAAQMMLTTSPFNFILPRTASRVAAALGRTNQVILVLGGDDRAIDAEQLERMKTTDFAAGLKAMEIPEEEAFRLAVTCGRSLTVLSRLKSSGIAPLPKWHDDPKLVPIVLAGGWNASNEHDRAVLAKLSNTTYDNVDVEARRLAAMGDSPLDLEGSIWTLRSPWDAFTLLGSLVDTASQQRLRDACLAVFSEQDSTVDEPDDARPLVRMRGADFRHSEWLRRGLARTLLLISGLHEAAGFKVTDRTAEQYVDGVVGTLPRLAEDARALASLKSEFPRLVEAAPHPLASALERVLEGDPQTWVPVIFRDQKDQAWWGSTSSPHTYFLWALETMAWNPAFLLRATSILMTLAEFDPGGQLANRPLHSLREIFLAWRPNTHASLDERIAVLRTICQKRPRVGLQLALSLLPVGHDHSGGTARPRLRDFGDAQSKPTTVRDVREAYRQYADLAVGLAETDIPGLTALVQNLPQLDPETRERVAAAIRRAADKVGRDAMFPVWSKLRDLIQRHRYFQDANWALRPEQLKPFEELRDAIRPSDPVRQIQWLFDEYIPKEGSPKKTDYIGDAIRDRSEALRGLLEAKGLSAVLQLAKVAKLPHLVGVALAESGAGLDVLKEALTLAIAPDSGVGLEFTMALSAVAHDLQGAAWDGCIADLAGKLEPGPATNLFLRWTDSSATWDFVGQQSIEIQKEYWTRKPVFRPASAEDQLFAYRKYIEVGRFTAVLDMVAYSENLLSTTQCIETLTGLMHELSEDPRKMQHVQYEVVHMIQELQKRDDVDLGQLAALEYQYLPMLEFQAEPTALHHFLGTSAEFFVSVIRDAFSPASGEREEITEERRLRARLAYRLLQSIKAVPGFTTGTADIDRLRSWISQVRTLAKEADRAVITDQQIGQILAYAPNDSEDGAWPAKPIRGLIEELAAPEIEKGIAISRFNQRGSYSKALYDGGNQERGLAAQYRSWAQLTTSWPRTSLILRSIADDWEFHAKHADSEAELDQLRD